MKINGDLLTGAKTNGSIYANSFKSKNLFNENQDRFYHGVTMHAHGSSIILDGTIDENYSSDYIQIGLYNIVNIVNNNLVGKKVSWSVSDNIPEGVVFWASISGNYYYANLTSSKQKRVVSNMAQLSGCRLYIPKGIVFNNLELTFQLEEGDPTEYVPFVDFDDLVISSTEPQEFNQRKTIWLQAGKNLFDKSSSNYDAWWDSGDKNKITLLSDGTIQTSAYYGSWRARSINIKNIKPSVTYTISLTLESSTSTVTNLAIIRLPYYNSSKELKYITFDGSNTAYLTKTGNYNYSFTAPSDLLYMGVSLSTGEESSVSIFKNIQVIQGGLIPSDYEDYINKKIYIKNNQNVYELFYDEEETSKENYRTYEQKIGTFIDGKPLYMKVITGKTPTVTTNGTAVTTNYETKISNPQLVWLSEGFFISDAMKIPFNFFNSSGRSLRAYLTSNSNFTITCDNTGYSNKAFYAVLKYTKSTD